MSDDDIDGSMKNNIKAVLVIILSILGFHAVADRISLIQTSDAMASGESPGQNGGSGGKSS